MKKVLFMAGLIVVLFTESSFAATFGDMFIALKESVAQLGDFIKLLFPVSGAICVGVGLWKFIQNNPQDTFLEKATWLGVGGALLAFGAFAMASSESLGLSPGGGGLNF